MSGSRTPNTAPIPPIDETCDCYTHLPRAYLHHLHRVGGWAWQMRSTICAITMREIREAIAAGRFCNGPKVFHADRSRGVGCHNGSRFLPTDNQDFRETNVLISNAYAQTAASPGRWTHALPIIAHPVAAL